jgi:hypothetical protein
MTIERAVVKGRIANAVETRSVFTANVLENGSDDSESLWAAYLAVFLSEVVFICSGAWVIYEEELYNQQGDQWELFATQNETYQGSEGGDYLPNAVSLVLLGKATGIKHVGRKFIPAIAETFTTANVLTGAAIGYAAQALINYVTPEVGLSGGTLTPGVIDKNLFFHPFVGGIVSSILGSCRRRKPGSGI